METHGFVNSETEAPKIQILLTLNLVQSLLQMAEKRKILMVKNRQKMPKNSQNGKNIQILLTLNLVLSLPQIMKINKFRQVWTSLGKVRPI